MDLSVLITRTLLGLDPLEVNDHINYYVATSGDIQIQWNKQTVRSPWVDGEITVQRSRGNVNRQLEIEVLGSDWQNCLANAQALATALSQDSFTMSWEWDGEVVEYLCEASEYSWKATKERWHAGRGIMTTNLIHKPTPTAGVL